MLSGRDKVCTWSDIGEFECHFLQRVTHVFGELLQLLRIHERERDLDHSVVELFLVRFTVVLDLIGLGPEGTQLFEEFATLDRTDIYKNFTKEWAPLRLNLIGVAQLLGSEIAKGNREVFERALGVRLICRVSIT